MQEEASTAASLSDQGGQDEGAEEKRKEAEPPLLQRLARLETDVLGAPSGNPLVDRVAALEEVVIGQREKGILLKRVAALEELLGVAYQ